MTDLISPSQMRMLGIIGGTAWHSTVEYYRYINASVNNLYGNQTNPPLVIYNLNQAQIHALQRADAWNRIADVFYEAALRLQAAGCDGLLFACNTAHRVFDAVSNRIGIPILHIADAIGESARRSNVRVVGFLGTIFSMEQTFLMRPLIDRYSLEMLVPASSESRARLHQIIQQELAMGKFSREAKRFILDEIVLLQGRGAQAIVLGCTELPLIVDQRDLHVPVLNSMLLHAQSGVDFVLRRAGEQPPFSGGVLLNH